MTGLIERLVKYLVRVYMPGHHIKKKATGYKRVSRKKRLEVLGGGQGA